jgi:hypothetical protein
MESIIDLIKSWDIHMIITVGGLFWYFTRNIELKMEEKVQKLSEDLNRKTEVQSVRSDRLYEMFIDLLKHEKKAE